jgi:hypothetical protein
MDTVTLGGLLRRADRLFTQAAACDGEGLQDPGSAARHLRRLTHALGRYLDIATLDPDHRDQAMRQQRVALDVAATRLLEATADLDIPAERVPSRGLHALSASADSLWAGADLLAAHAAADPAGNIFSRTDWAKVLRTDTVTAALTEEINHWTDRVAILCERQARLPAVTGTPGAVALAAAGKRLAAAPAAAPGALAGGGDPADGWELLYAIPAAKTPARIPPGDGETVTQLCDGIAVSAARLKGAAFAMQSLPSGRLDSSAPAWRQAATIADATFDIARLGVASALHHPDGPSLHAAAEALGAAQVAWVQVGSGWDVMAAVTGSPVSEAAAEAEDLRLRLGRLVFQDPGWQPGRAASVTAVPTGDAARRWRFREVLNALHRAADALARMAEANLAVIPRAAYAQEFYMPGRALADEYASSRVYVAAPATQITQLVQAYEIAAEESTRAAEILDDLALHHGASTKILALARRALRSDQRRRDSKRGIQPPTHRRVVQSELLRPLAATSAGPPARSAVQGPIEREVRGAGIREPELLSQAAELDRAAARTRRRRASEIAWADAPYDPGAPRLVDRTATPKRAPKAPRAARRLP